jgi:hypothetical protein
LNRSNVQATSQYVQIVSDLIVPVFMPQVSKAKLRDQGIMRCCKK